MTDVWPLVHAERHALVDDLSGLSGLGQVTSRDV